MAFITRVLSISIFRIFILTTHWEDGANSILPTLQMGIQCTKLWCDLTKVTQESVAEREIELRYCDSHTNALATALGHSCLPLGASAHNLHLLWLPNECHRCKQHYGIFKHLIFNLCCLKLLLNLAHCIKLITLKSLIFSQLNCLETNFSL